MTARLITILQSLGLEEKQAKVYLACLELGSSSILQIAKRAQLKRTTVYNIVEFLLEQRLLSKFTDEKGQKFIAESPKKLLKILEERKQELIKIIPNLLAITNIENEIKPEIRFYQGKEGLKAVYEDTLNSCSKSDEILSYASAEDIYSVLSDYILSYLKRRIKKGIKMRAIVRDSVSARKHKQNDKIELRQAVIVIDDNFDITIEKNIYADKVAVMSFRQYPMGVIIKSSQIAKSEKAIFELLWGKLLLNHENNQ